MRLEEVGRIIRGHQGNKGCKAYILKEKFASFKMKEDESVSDMFH